MQSQNDSQVDFEIIITTRNRIFELLKTLNRILSYGVDQDRIFIIDDASEDGTFDKVKSTYPRISIRQNNESKGLIANRNELIKWTTSQYIVSIDDDSHFMSINDLHCALSYLGSDTTFGIFTFSPHESLEPPPLLGSGPGNIVMVKTFIGCGFIIKREVFEIIGDLDESLVFYCEEIDYSLRMFKSGLKVIADKSLIVHHRINWSERERQLESDLRNGVYGAIWRSKLGFKNNLRMIIRYYPFPFSTIFFWRYVFKRFLNFLVLKSDFKGFAKGLLSFLRDMPNEFTLTQRLSYSQFIRWIYLRGY